MKDGFIEFSCKYDKEDRITFDTNGGSLGIDLFSERYGNSVNVGVVLDRDKIEELIKFLQDKIDV